MTTSDGNPPEVCRRGVIIVPADLVDPPAAGPAGRTFPLAAGYSAERQIDVMSQCLVRWDLFVKSGDVAEDGVAATRYGA